ncbi:LysR family transcriptional regulator [Streptomyces nodosus]|uniref:LysR family transcriptional regulator n=1 Tax=Streptomyces nodosus TaxID=40318 RepID=UPI00130E12B9|nr:LysR family transcriptional regulator [Streptomyces nodosus]
MSILETREMECFVAVAESLHFGAAAERLGTTQPAVSRTVARLERRLGVRLLDRTTRQVALTPVGETFLADCRAILVSVERAARQARRSGQSGRLVVAVRPGTAQGAFADVLASYRARPGSIPVDVVFTHMQEAALRDGTADVALLCQTDPLPEDLGRMEVGWEEPVALLPVGHPLAARSALKLADLLALGNFTERLPLESLESVIDRVALADLVVITGHTARRRLGPTVTAVPVLDSPSAHLHLTWLPTVQNPERDVLLRRAGHVLDAVRSRQPVH